MEKLLAKISDKLRNCCTVGCSSVSAKVEYGDGVVEVYLEHGYTEALFNGDVWEKLEDSLPTFEEIKYSTEAEDDDYWDIHGFANEADYNRWKYGI